MCTLHERITALCKEKGVSASRMCLDLGLSKSTMSDMKSGRKKGVSTETAQKIAGYFDITVDQLLGKEEEEQKEKPTVKYSELDEGQQRIVDLFADVPKDKIDMFIRVAESILGRDQ